MAKVRELGRTPSESKEKASFSLMGVGAGIVEDERGVETKRYQSLQRDLEQD